MEQPSRGGWARVRGTSRWAALRAVAPTLLLGAVIGIAGWTGFGGAIEATNQPGFCISCHEMRGAIYEDYRQTVHYASRTGVRAECADCHVPRDSLHRLTHKIGSLRELYGKLARTLDTPAKLEARRAELAQRVWKEMKATDSRECRGCHQPAAMLEERQSAIAWSMHAAREANGQTCIDCHFGIAHRMPDGPGPQELFDREGRALAAPAR